MIDHVILWFTGRTDLPIREGLELGFKLSKRQHHSLRQGLNIYMSKVVLIILWWIHIPSNRRSRRSLFVSNMLSWGEPIFRFVVPSPSAMGCWIFIGWRPKIHYSSAYAQSHPFFVGCVWSPHATHHLVHLEHARFVVVIRFFIVICRTISSPIEWSRMLTNSSRPSFSVHNRIVLHYFYTLLKRIYISVIATHTGSPILLWRVHQGNF